MNTFEWEGLPKNIGSMFLGTTPELELATYTICYFARPNGKCEVQMNGQKYLITTFTMNYNGEEYVGTAFPDI